MILSQTDSHSILKATQSLRAGHLVALPTETVYGLAADACNSQAVALIYAAKGRPAFNPLISHVSDSTMAARLVQVNALAQKLMDHFWPGPLTLVLPKADASPVADAVSAGLETLAVRCPNNATVRQIIADLDSPIAAPSANPSGRISPTCVADVVEGLGDKVSLIIDGGPCTVGIESTIVKVGDADSPLTLLRPGSITSEALTDVTGLSVIDPAGSTITAPGMMTSHYAPSAPVQLNYKGPAGTDFFTLGFGAVDCDYNLSKTADLSEAATHLFHGLRLADKANKPVIKVSPIPHSGIGVAINDRLKRAAAPRDAEGGLR